MKFHNYYRKSILGFNLTVDFDVETIFFLKMNNIKKWCAQIFYQFYIFFFLIILYFKYLID